MSTSRRFEMYQFYSKINRGQVSRLLYRDCPLFGGSVIKSFTVIDPSINLSDLNL